MTGSAPRSRADLLAWYRRNRERSSTLFDLLSDRAYYSQPIALRHPIVFYEGHLPAFSFNTLVKKALGGPSIDEHLEALFARGIDPDEPSSDELPWPSRDVVRSFADEADRRVMDSLLNADLDQPGHPFLDGGEAVVSILEHEAMHHETLLYMWHRLPFSDKKKPGGYSPRTDGVSPPAEWVDVPAGSAVLGVERDTIPFGWDNECPALVVDVPSFAIERNDVTNDRFLEFVDGGGYQDERWWSAEDWRWIQIEGVAHPLFWERAGEDWYWRGMFDRIPLPSSWPVYVTYAEASAFARWRGMRLPTEPEFQRSAYGSPNGDRSHPWGNEEPSARTGVFDLASWDPEPAGSHPDGASAWGDPRLGGQRLGVDEHAVRSVPGIPSDTLLPGVLRRFLRRPVFRDQRGLPRYCVRASAAHFSELVPTTLPVRLCHIPLRRERL